MKVTIRSFVFACVVAAIASTAIAQDKQPTPEERAYKFRTSLFQTFAWKIGQLARAKAGDDKAAFAQHANDLAYLSTMIEEGFTIENSLPEGTKAKPEIWEDFTKFQDKAANLSNLAKALAESDAMTDFSPRDFGSKACGACHRDFKIKD